MSNLQATEIHLAARPAGMPRESDFAVATRALAPPGEGEVLVRNLWMSVDPYMRGRMTDRQSYVPPFQLGEVMQGGAVGRVVASRAPDLAEGDYVLSMQGWRDLAVGPAKSFQKIDPALGPVEAYLGALGMPGLTAYVGLVRIAEVREGDVVFVSAAAGAVGAVVCQLAKARGCTVIASAGSAEKRRWLEEVARVDRTIDYKSCGDLGAALGAAAPDGIDVYFDNVGGAHLEAAIARIKPFGRLALCGMIELYNDGGARPGPSNLMMLIGKSLKMQGFIVSNHSDLRAPFLAEATALIHAGKLTWRETVEDGLERAPSAFIKLFTGENVGKMLVRIAVE